jgi:predicted RNA-binding protein associated with RNAse of E/G family
MTNFTEIKRRLNGTISKFECKLIHSEPNHVVIRYDITGDAVWEVAGVKLPGGTVTYAYYWADRPYNVYHWVLPDGATAGYYFNLSDQTKIGNDYVEWRDLVVDILITPNGRYEVLDEDELPMDSEPALQARLHHAKTTIIDNRARLVAEIESQTRQLLT